MKKIACTALLIAGFAISFSACSKMEERNVGTPTPSNPDVPPTPADVPYQGVLDGNGQPFAKAGDDVADGKLFSTNDGSSFILSARGDNDSVFSTQLPMTGNGISFGGNCIYASTDCSGECHIDGNWGTPTTNALLVANNWGEVSGPAARVLQYDGSPALNEAIEMHSRMDLYGDGPYCSSTLVILDHYYILKDVTADHPIDNTGWKQQH